MTVTIKVDTRGLTDAQRRLRAINRLISNLAPALDEIGDALVENVRQRFARSKGADGRAWQRTKAGNKPLVRTGALRDSVTHTVSRNKVSIGSSLPYAAIHQFGGRAGRGGMSRIPARPYLPGAGGDVAPEDRADIERIIRAFISRAIARNV